MSAPIEREPRHPSRRDFLALGVGAFVVAALPWASRGRSSPVRRSIPVMGTVAEIAVVHRDARHAQGAIEAALAELRLVEATMTRFRDDSEVGRANRHAAGAPVAVSAGTAAVLVEALRWAAASGGRFDPALGRATALWEVTQRVEPPAPGALRRYAGEQLYRQVEVEARRGVSTVAFHLPEVGLDLGGIAKGYAVDRAVEALRGWGIRHALVSAGGDLYALGRSPTDDPWQVGIRSPHDPSGLAGTLALEDRAVATSGDYERFFEHGGRRYHHLLDPRTGAPRESAARSVSVAADSCMAADAGSTAVFGCEGAAAARILAAGGRGTEIVHFG
jgi:FAD:protein FMN transferase